MDSILSEINYHLLGKDISHHIFTYIKSISQIKSFTDKDKNIVYISCYNEGISLCFENNILNAIFYYNEGVQHFKQYKGKVLYDINISKMKNVDIVEYLGDTPKKGGGKYPIHLSYPLLGIDISFLSSNWNDTNNPITYITLYQKSENELYCGVCTKKINEIKYTCDNNCNIVFYCSEKCKSLHIKYHLKHCS